MILPRPGGGVAPYGTTAEIVRSAPAPGGRYHVVVKGRRRFRVQRTWEVDGYRSAAVAWARDAPPEDAGEGSEAAVVAAVHARILATELRGLLVEWMAEALRGGQISASFGQLRPTSHDWLPGAHGRLGAFRWTVEPHL